MGDAASMPLLTRVARWFGLLWALAAYAYLVSAPFYATATATTTGPARHGSATLVAINGLGVLAIIAVPVLAAALPFLPLAPPRRRVAAITAATIASLFVLLGAMSVGAFFLPTAVALIVVAAGSGKS